MQNSNFMAAPESETYGLALFFTDEIFFEYSMDYYRAMGYVLEITQAASISICI